MRIAVAPRSLKAVLITGVLCIIGFVTSSELPSPAVLLPVESHGLTYQMSNACAQECSMIPSFVFHGKSKLNLLFLLAC